MPQRPDGAAARPQRVTFTKGSAERIAAVVRDYEAGDRGAEPLRFGTVATSDAKKLFRIATFSGAWSIGATKTVTFKHATATPNTAVATNLFFPVTGSGTSDCAIAKDGTAWFLIDVPLATATAVFVGVTATGVIVQSTVPQTVVSNVVIAATLNTANCSITVQRTQTTASVTVVGTTATGIQVGSTYTATYLRIGAS